MSPRLELAKDDPRRHPNFERDDFRWRLAEWGAEPTVAAGMFVPTQVDYTDPLIHAPAWLDGGPRGIPLCRRLGALFSPLATNSEDITCPECKARYKEIRG